MDSTNSPPWYRKWAWTMQVFLGVLLVLFGVFVLFSPIDSNDFEHETGVVLEELAASEPEVVEYLEREARLLAAATIGFGLFAAALAATLVRDGNQMAWNIQWILPAVLAIIVVVFATSGANTLAGMYAAVTVLAGASLWFARPADG